MEMPEGWINLNGWNDGSYPGGCSYKIVSEALELMKEMAEALEQIDVDPPKPEIPLDPASAIARKALKKFNEWK